MFLGLQKLLPRNLTSRLGTLLYRYEKAVMVLVASAALSAVLLNLEFNLLEAGLYDLRTSAAVGTQASPEIVMVTLDDATLKQLDQLSPLTLDYHARFMEALERYEPRAVGYLIDMNQVGQSNPDLFQTSWPTRFIDSANRLRARGSPVILGTPFEVTGETDPPYPLSTLPHSLAVIHRDENVFSEDKITRRGWVTLNDKPTFHYEVARSLGRLEPGQYPNGTVSVPEIDSRYFFLRYHGSTVMNSRNQGQLPYARISFADVLQASPKAEALRGKIVLVGTLHRERSTDFAYTPFSRASLANPKIVIHANILDSMLHNDGIQKPHPWVNAGITFLMVAFVLWWVLTLKPLYAVFATISLSLGLMLMGQILFQWGSWWIRESQPLVGIFMGYYLAVPYRLIREYKKRWEYQRKNELLTQVEELKTNFLNLVTHDLKTPIARIQGLAEMVLRKGAARLLDTDRESLRHIVNSTDELNRFISSILELSKVESERLHLRVQSKDINQLIEICVEGFRPHARTCQMTILTQLEPLFPIRVDASLISKVLGNLIDNALKYSPRGATIWVESKEVGAWVEISVRDQGIGLTPEEADNLFTRFYRAKNDRTAEIGGTGLGLYLTKYFIEAHGGRVEVETERNKGSIFKILLPVEGAAVGAVAEPAQRNGRGGGLTRGVAKLVKNFSERSGQTVR